MSPHALDVLLNDAATCRCGVPSLIHDWAFRDCMCGHPWDWHGPGKDCIGCGCMWFH